MKLKAQIMSVIVVPLCIGLIGTAAVTCAFIYSRYDHWLLGSETASKDLELSAISQTAKNKAAFATQVLQRPMNDLYSYADFATRILAGDIVSKMFVESTEAVTKPPSSYPCACGWNGKENPYGTKAQCTSTWTRGVTRSNLKQAWALEKDGNDPTTGARSKSSFTGGGTGCCQVPTGSRTNWYTDFKSLPGYQDTSEPACTSCSSYARLVSSSRFSVLTEPLYNYYSGADRYAAIYTGWKADGLRHGAYGCNNDQLWMDTFTNNLAAQEINRDLCPEGKVGFDSRCRPWFSGPRETWPSGKVNPGVWVSNPYLFGGSGRLGNTMSMVLNVGGKDVGVAALDFSPMELKSALTDTKIMENGYGFVAAPRKIAGGDTVIHPRLGKNVLPIECYVVPGSCDGTGGTDGVSADTVADAAKFAPLLAKLKSGASMGASEKPTSYTRTSEKDSDEKEEWVMAYAPTKVRILKIKENAGVVTSTEDTLHVYTVGVTVPLSDILKPFIDIKSSIATQLNTQIIIAICILGLVAYIVGMAGTKFADEITKPVELLVRMCKFLNNKDFDAADEIKRKMGHRGSCKEVTKILETFEKLTTVIKFANDAAFKNNVEKALAMNREALKLFDTLDNKKGQGIATNNIGNLLCSPERADYTGALQYYKSSISNAELLLNNCIGGDRGPPVNAPQGGEMVAMLGTGSGINLHGHSSEKQQEVLGYKGMLANRMNNYAQVLHAIESDAAPELNRVNSSPISNLLSDWKENTTLDHMQSSDVYGNVAVLDAQLRDGLPADEGLVYGKRLFKYHCKQVIKVAESIVEGAFCTAREHKIAVHHHEQAGVGMQFLIARGTTSEYSDVSGDSPEGRRKTFVDSALQLCKANTTKDVELVLDFLADMLDTRSAFETDVLKSICTLFKTHGPSTKYGDCSTAMDAFTGGPPKDVALVLDYSGSMNSMNGRTTRIADAVKNMLVVYDKYINDEDLCTFVRFNHQSQVVFPMGKKSASKRNMIAQSMDPNYTTACYQAIQDALKQLAAHNGDRVSNKWIVLVCDGDDSTREDYWHTENKLQSADVKLITIGIGAGISSSTVSIHKKLCAAGNDGIYISAGSPAQLEAAFKTVQKMLSGLSLTTEEM